MLVGSSTVVGTDVSTDAIVDAGLAVAVAEIGRGVTVACVPPCGVTVVVGGSVVVACALFCGGGVIVG